MASTNLCLVFDTPAILAGNTREWQRFKALGECYLPKVVFEELRFLCNRAPEPAQETTAREFFRFFPTSGWQTHDHPQPHPALQAAQGQDLSKRARQAIAILELVYGLTQTAPNLGVVLVSNTPPLLQKLKGLGANNLCGIPYSRLKQWSLSGQRPDSIIQMLGDVQSSATARSTPRSPTAAQSPTHAQMRPVTRSRHSTASTPSRVRVNSPTKRSRQPLAAQLISLTLVAITLGVAGLVAWKMLQPQQFDAFWQEHSLF